MPARVNVLWDNLGVQAAPKIIRDTRETAAVALSVASGAMAAQLLTLFLPPGVFHAQQIRTSYGQYTHHPQPAVPVQMEVAAVFTPDPRDILWYRSEAILLGLSALVLNWFEAQSGVCDAGRIDAVRVSLMGLGPELLYELDPRTRIIMDGFGLANLVRGQEVPRRL